MLFNMFDADRSGTIGLQEFAGIFAYINQWQSIFSYYDKDRSGQMCVVCLSTATVLNTLRA
jgi:Ca2+-binding EF-hand superfamily protein